MSSAGSAAASRRLVDLSHTVEHGLVTYPGLPAPVISDHLSREASRAHYADGVEFQIGKIEMVANTGTYVDAPSHRYEGEADLSGLELTSVADLPGLVIRAPHGDTRRVWRELLEGKPIKGRAVLVHTGWDEYWGTERYFGAAPFLTREAALYLAKEGAALVGIDSLNIDDRNDTSRPVHSILLGAGIPVAEHLCELGALPDEGFRFFAVPVKVKGMGTFPVRAFAAVD